MPRQPLMTTASLAFFISIAAAQDAPPTLEATPKTVESTVTAVTAYPGRASVTRSAKLELAPGLYELQFTGLPDSIQADSIQARASGPAKVIGVDFEMKAVATAPSPRIAELDKQIDQIRRALQTIDEQNKINAAQGVLIDKITVRVGDDATKDGGTPKLDIDALTRQIDFLAQQREKLMQRRLELDQLKRDQDEKLRILQEERNAIAGTSKTDRMATITAAVSAPSQIVVDLTYLVANATWEPNYNIRAASDGKSVSIEYDALLSQRTGEDWNDVQLTLSTAQPTLAANPPSLQPWFVDIYVPPPPAERASGPAGQDKFAERRAYAAKSPGWAANAALADGQDEESRFRAGVELLGRDAAVAGTGPSVTYQLPRRVTVKTSAQKQQRTRIATIDAEPKFTHIAVPALTDAVYIRGEVTNASAFQLLPGRAAVFVGQDYVGPTVMPSVAPQGQFKVHFGIDQSVKATRQLVKKYTKGTGIFSGGLRTIFEYRLAVDNGAGKAIMLELWDRMPISRTDQVKIELVDPKPALATDAEYVEQQRPQGLLKWQLSVPANATGKSAYAATYNLQVDRAKDVNHTPLPE